MGARFYLGGGIGSGKSTAAARLSALGGVVVSGDDAGREVLVPGTAETDAVSRRWPDVVDEHGVVDRRHLGRLVFSDPQALADLEAITGPGIRQRILSRIPAAGVVLVEVPVLRDFAGEDWPWVVVDAPDSLRHARAVARGAMSGSEVAAVMARQPTRGQWLAAAAWVIDNSGSLVDLDEQCRRVWEAISSR